jgi:hypothetical protein
VHKGVISRIYERVLNSVRRKFRPYYLILNREDLGGTYIYTHMYVFIWKNVCVYIYEYMFIYLYVYIYIYYYLIREDHGDISYIYICMYVCMYVYMHIYVLSSSLE